MKQTLRQETVPVFTLEIDRAETSLASVDAICAYFRARIEAHKFATFIAEFDHLAHTGSLADGRIGPDILAAKNVVFCLCIALPEAWALALRPRSIGVAEVKRGFVITFMESPMPVVNAALEDWAKGLCDLQPESA